MNNSTPGSWQKRIYLVYLVSLLAWAAVTAFMLIRFFIDGMKFENYLSSTSSGIGYMFMALPGLAFFFWQSRKLREANLDEAFRILDRIMFIQHLTGIFAMVGGLLGSIPFLVNFFSVLTSTPADLWNNLPMMLPWVSLYGFITTYIFALVISRRAKKLRKSAAN